jgi:hypothetical protein
MLELILGTAIIAGLIVVDKIVLRQDDQPIIERIRSDFKRMDEDYSSIPVFEDPKSSYTRDKSAIYLCLRRPDGQYYSYNTLIYVAIHELAHVLSETYSVGEHNQEFNDRFGYLLRRATNMGIYDPSIPLPPVYCGVENH